MGAGVSERSERSGRSGADLLTRVACGTGWSVPSGTGSGVPTTAPFPGDSHGSTAVGAAAAAAASGGTDSTPGVEVRPAAGPGRGPVGRPTSGSSPWSVGRACPGGAVPASAGAALCSSSSMATTSGAGGQVTVPVGPRDGSAMAAASLGGETTAGLRRAATTRVAGDGAAGPSSIGAPKRAGRMTGRCCPPASALGTATGGSAARARTRARPPGGGPAPAPGPGSGAGPIRPPRRRGLRAAGGAGRATPRWSAGPTRTWRRAGAPPGRTRRRRRQARGAPLRRRRHRG